MKYFSVVEYKDNVPFFLCTDFDVGSREFFQTKEQALEFRARKWAIQRIQSDARGEDWHRADLRIVEFKELP